ncbi:hypothetical protein BH11ACT2_BH11ACT2_20000 [soil metagenome]
MQSWNDFLNWLGSDAGWRVLTAAVFPFVAIVVAGIIAALIGRGATRRLISHQDRELQASAISAMIESGRTATMWSSLSSGAQAHSDSQFNAADIRVRLLPLSGASAAADWATHEIRAMRRDSAGFSFQADQTFSDYRDRLLEWQRRPGRARKLFALDLERFRFEDSSADNELVEQQRRWAAQQAAAEQAAVAQDEPAVAPTPIVASTPVAASVPAEATAVDEPPTSAYAMPVAASDHVNEPVDSEPVDSEPVEPQPIEPQADPAAESEPESEPNADAENVEFVEPHVDDAPADDAPADEQQEPAHEEPTHDQWEGRPTQALPLIEPESPYAPAESHDENRSL